MFARSITPSMGATVRLAVVLLLLAALPGLPAGANHPERHVYIRHGAGGPPSTVGPVLVVCRPDSGRRIAQQPSGLREKNRRLLRECRYGDLQRAVNEVPARGSRIVMLPGVYREEPSRRFNQPCLYEREHNPTFDYENHTTCPNERSLVAVLGDDSPGNATHRCSDRLCDLRIEGAGAAATDVVLQGGFDAEGNWAREVGLRLDRADGVVVRNLTVEGFAHAGVAVVETDRWRVERVVSRWNGEYGILARGSDRGIARDCVAADNGMAGLALYDTPVPGGPRFAASVAGCRLSGNTIGLHAVAGRFLHIHDNAVTGNGSGLVLDSARQGHAGMPQRNSIIERNRVVANNLDAYASIRDARCRIRTPARRAPQSGVRCPFQAVPVGSGIVVLGGNANQIKGNDISGHRRAGLMLFSVPGPLRGSPDPREALDTSHTNRHLANRLGSSPAGADPNRVDLWWDGGGQGNCWQDNRGPRPLRTDPAALPGCAAPSGPVGAPPAKAAELAACLRFDRDNSAEPPGCTWLRLPR